MADLCQPSSRHLRRCRLTLDGADHHAPYKVFLDERIGDQDRRSGDNDQGELDQTLQERALLQRWLDYEAALARAQASLGLVPVEAADEITRQARAEHFDLESMREGIDRTVHPLVPLVWQLAGRCEGDAGRWVHWGATTQDVMDTATILQLRDALALIDETTADLAGILADLAQRHRATAMAGRTHGQQALPITFGFKVAGWLAELKRHRGRLLRAREGSLMGQFGGAVGTLAGMGEGDVDALAVQRALMAELGLRVPPIA